MNNFCKFQFMEKLKKDCLWTSTGSACYSRMKCKRGLVCIGRLTIIDGASLKTPFKAAEGEGLSVISHDTLESGCIARKGIFYSPSITINGVSLHDDASHSSGLSYAFYNTACSYSFSCGTSHDRSNKPPCCVSDCYDD